jgi:hypothetical protein
MPKVRHSDQRQRTSASLQGMEGEIVRDLQRLLATTALWDNYALVSASEPISVVEFELKIRNTIALERIADALDYIVDDVRKDQEDGE